MGKVRPVRSFYAARGHLQKCELLSCIKPKTSFLSSTLNVSVKKDMSGREDLFLHQFSVVEIVHLRVCKPFHFALPISAALGFKFFSNAAFRVNSVGHPCNKQCPTKV